MWLGEDIEPKYPPLDPLAIVWRRQLQALGMFGQGVNGPAPVSWQEVAAWDGLTGADVPPWAAEALVSASRAFCGEYSGSKGAPAPMPYHVEFEGEDLAKAEAWAARRLG